MDYFHNSGLIFLQYDSVSGDGISQQKTMILNAIEKSFGIVPS